MLGKAEEITMDILKIVVEAPPGKAARMRHGGDAKESATKHKNSVKYATTLENR